MHEADRAHPFYLVAPLALFFAVFFAVPLMLLLWVSLQATNGAGLGQYARFFADGLGVRVLGSTLRIGFETTLACLVLGYPLALLFRRAPPWARSVITMIVLLPLLTSVVVRTFAWIVILGRQGVVNSALLSLGMIDLPLRLLYSEGGAQIHARVCVDSQNVIAVARKEAGQSAGQCGLSHASFS